MTGVALDEPAGARPGAARARTAAPVTRSAPWGPEEMLRWVITVGLGGVVIAVAWYLGAGEATLGRQVGPTDAAVAGLLLSGMGNLVWLLRGRRAVGERRRALLPDVEAVAEPVPRGPLRTGSGGAPRSGTEPTGSLLVAGPELRLFHRPDCALAAGRADWVAAAAATHDAAGRRPCGVCRP